MKTLKGIAAVTLATACVAGVTGVVYITYSIKLLRYLFGGAGLICLAAGLSVIIYRAMEKE